MCWSCPALLERAPAGSCGSQRKQLWPAQRPGELVRDQRHAHADLWLPESLEHGLNLLMGVCKDSGDRHFALHPHCHFSKQLSGQVKSRERIFPWTLKPCGRTAFSLLL